MVQVLLLVKWELRISFKLHKLQGSGSRTDKQFQETISYCSINWPGGHRLALFLEILPCGMHESKFEERVPSGDVLFHIPYYTFDLNSLSGLWVSKFLLLSHWDYWWVGQKNKKSHLWHGLMIVICWDILGGRLLRDYYLGLIHVLRNLDLKLLMVSHLHWLEWVRTSKDPLIFLSAQRKYWKQAL